MKRGARFITIALTSTVLVGAFLAAAADRRQRAAPKCFGKKATIVGTNKADVLKGTAKADVIVGLGGNDTIKALGGKDRICGGSGNDKLYGGPGYDLIWGDVGNDQLFSQGGNDDMWGGGERHARRQRARDVWAWFSDAPNGVIVDLSTGQATGEGTDKLIGIEALVGSDYDDTLIGDENYERVRGAGRRRRDRRRWRAAGPRRVLVGEGTGHRGPDRRHGHR